MRKILLSLCALAAISASAQDTKLVRIDTYAITVDADGNETSALSTTGNVNYYDKANSIAMVQSSYQRSLYTYNANGTVASVDAYSWGDATGWAYSSTTEYEYNDKGLVAKMGTISKGVYTQYTYDEQGNEIMMENLNNGASTYSTSYNNTYNENKQLVIKDQVLTTTGAINQRTMYTYNADGSVKTVETGYYVADDQPLTYPSVSEYTYNADGSIAKVRVTSTSRYGENTTEQVYVYATFAASYVPQNVKTAAGENSTVTVTWDAVEGATAYKVIYDKEVADCTGTTYTTGMLLDGEHTFYVQAVIGDEAKNISEAAAASVKDAGKLPAENFKVVGVELGEDQNGNVAYNTTVQFTLPEGHSEIKSFGVYYDLSSAWSKVSVDVASATIEGNAVTLVVPFANYNIGTWNNDTYEYDLGTKPLYVVISYASGDADPSNVEYWDFAANESSIAAASTSATAVAIYSASGAKISAPQKGINIIRMSNNEVKKVLVK